MLKVQERKVDREKEREREKEKWTVFMCRMEERKKKIKRKTILYVHNKN